LSFYGPPPKAEDMARIKARVYGFYGENDARIDAMIPDAKKAMKAAGKFYEPVTYKGAGHGFMRSGEAPPPTDAAQMPAYEANRQAHNDAWVRVKKIMKKL
jgi:carboxymethylenebutenolidase